MKPGTKIDVVTPLEREMLRFRVASRSESGTAYIVDLAAFGCNGRCECDDFKFRKEPKLWAGAHPSDALRCRHIRLARDYLLDVDVLPRLAAFGNGHKVGAGQHTRAQRAALRERT